MEEENPGGWVEVDEVEVDGDYENPIPMNAVLVGMDDDIDSDSDSEPENWPFLRLRQHHIPIAEFQSESQSQPVGQQQQHDDRFNIDLTTEHSYLRATERVSGIKMFEPGHVYLLQFFSHPAIIYPGEIFPMILQEETFAQLRDTSDGMFFGLVYSKKMMKHAGKTDRVFGVTCQVYERSDLQGGNVGLKCLTYHRFEMMKIEFDGGLDCKFAQVRILPEIVLPNVLEAYSSTALNRLAANRSLNVKMKRHQACSSAWPKFVYDQYDLSLYNHKIQQFVTALRLDDSKMPCDVTKLSFWLAQQLPLSRNDKEIIFLMNSANERIIYIAKAFTLDCGFSCVICNQMIAAFEDVLPMSKLGCSSKFCNSAGYVHDLTTMSAVKENALFSQSSPTEEFSWFPGYKWEIAGCTDCQSHIGWIFTASNPETQPRSFYGLAGRSVTIMTKVEAAT